MVFTEFAEASGNHVPLQFFATDLNSQSIEKARAGVYPKDIAQDVSAERLERFFVEVDGRYRIAKSIRDMCVFSRHNVLADPPFARIDLISCRNLLIYLEPVLQQRILPLLHYALKPERLPVARGLGDDRLPPGPVRGEGRPAQDLRQESQALAVLPALPAATRRVRTDRFRSASGPARDEGEDLEKEADRVLLTKFAPPGVLISAEFEILKYCGDTGPYLAPAPGKASLNLLKMLREGLLVGLRAGRPPGREGRGSGAGRRLAGQVQWRLPRGRRRSDPDQGRRGEWGGFLVLFEEAAPSGPTPSGPEDRPRAGSPDPTPRPPSGPRHRQPI